MGGKVITRRPSRYVRRVTLDDRHFGLPTHGHSHCEGGGTQHAGILRLILTAEIHEEGFAYLPESEAETKRLHVVFCNNDHLTYDILALDDFDILKHEPWHI